MASKINEEEVLKMMGEIASLLGEVERLKKERDEITRYYNSLVAQANVIPDWHLITRKKPNDPVIVYDPFYGKIITSWDNDHWRGYHFIDPLYWTEVPAGPHNDLKWYPSSEKPEDGTIVIMKTIEFAYYDEKRDMWQMDQGEVSCYWRRVEPTHVTPEVAATA